MADKMDALRAFLDRAGFRPDGPTTETRQAEADAAGMSDRHPYKVLGHYTRGDVAIHVEQNVGEDTVDGYPVVLTYPEVVVIEVAGVRVSANPVQLTEDMLDAVVADLRRAAEANVTVQPSAFSEPAVDTVVPATPAPQVAHPTPE